MALQSQNNQTPISGPVLFVVLLVLSLVFTAFYAREGESGPLHSVQSAVSGIVAPFKFVGALGGAGTDTVATVVEDATASDATLNDLRDQNKQLRSRVSQLEEYYQETKTLQDLLGIRDSYDLETVGARVIGKSTTPWEQMITIDRGESDGIRSGLSVMGTTGLIGQVVHTTASTAEVRLLQDQKSGVAALVQSSRAEGVVSGSLEGVLYLEGLDTDPVLGDVIVTSGLGGGFSRGIIIGTVAKVEKKQGDSASKIIVIPNSTTGPLQDVLVVLSVGSEGAASVNAAAADKAPAAAEDATTTNGDTEGGGADA